MTPIFRKIAMSPKKSHNGKFVIEIEIFVSKWVWTIQNRFCSKIFSKICRTFSIFWSRLGYFWLGRGRGLFSRFSYYWGAKLTTNLKLNGTVKNHFENRQDKDKLDFNYCYGKHLFSPKLIQAGILGGVRLKLRYRKSKHGHLIKLEHHGAQKSGLQCVRVHYSWFCQT